MGRGWKCASLVSVGAPQECIIIGVVRLYLPPARESLLETGSERESPLLCFSCSLVWGGKNILNVVRCVLHSFDVCVGLRH